MEFIRVNEEIYYPKQTIVSIAWDDIEMLKERALQNARKRVRICAHPDTENALHEMLIVHTKGCYVRPHRHKTNSESFHVIEGEADIVIFDNSGNIEQVITMGKASSGDSFFYRLPPGNYHSLLVNSDFFVFHEVTNGPFRPEHSEAAAWSPSEQDEDEAKRFLQSLEISVEKWAKK